MPKSAFTDRELDVMAVLWDRGPATVAEVRSRVGDDLAYTTVLSILQTLEQKGRVTHERDGKAYRYRALVPREAAGQSALQRLTRKVFGGSAELLLAQLVSDRRLTEEELLRLRKAVDQRLREMRETVSGKREAGSGAGASK